MSRPSPGGLGIFRSENPNGFLHTEAVQDRPVQVWMKMEPKTGLEPVTC